MLIRLNAVRIPKLDEFDTPELAGKVYGRAYPLVDVTVIPNDEIMGHRSITDLTLLQKNIHQRDIATLSDQLTTLLMADYLSSLQVIALIVTNGAKVGSSATCVEILMPEDSSPVASVTRPLPGHTFAVSTSSDDLLGPRQHRYSIC